MKILLLLVIVALLSSCATVTTRKEYKVKVYSYEPNVKAEINDSIYTLPAKVRVKRSKENLSVKYINDSLSKDFTVKAACNPSFMYGNLAFTFMSPIGYAVDMTNTKRFYYGKQIVINSYTKDTIDPRPGKGFTHYYSKSYPVKKRQVNFLVSMPYANHFHIRPKDEGLKNTAGFFGIAVGAEYYYNENKFFAVKGSAAIDFEAPVPVPFDYWGPYETVRATSVTLTDNFKFRRFTAGYGIHHTRYTWQLRNGEYEPPFQLPPNPTPVQQIEPRKKLWKQ